MKTYNTGLLIGGESDGTRFKSDNIAYKLQIPLKRDLFTVGKKDNKLDSNEFYKEEFFLEKIHTKYVTFTFYRFEGLTLEQALSRLFHYYKKESNEYTIRERS